jgi:hypothetical protein
MRLVRYTFYTSRFEEIDPLAQTIGFEEPNATNPCGD